jgi:hypothetical protein
VSRPPDVRDQVLPEVQRATSAPPGSAIVTAVPAGPSVLPAMTVAPSEVALSTSSWVRKSKRSLPRLWTRGGRVPPHRVGRMHHGCSDVSGEIARPDGPVLVGEGLERTAGDRRCLEDVVGQQVHCNVVGRQVHRNRVIVNAVRNSRLKPVEAPEVVLDREDIDMAEAGLGGVAADRVGADHGAGAGGVVVE